MLNYLTWLHNEDAIFIAARKVRQTLDFVNYDGLYQKKDHKVFEYHYILYIANKRAKSAKEPGLRCWLQ